jgi:hypothetical protein
VDLIDTLKNLPPDLTSFLAFIATPAVLGPILSELLEYLPAFQKLASAYKTLALYVLMALVGLLSFGIVRWVPASALESLQPVYSILIAAAAFFASSQLFHAKAHGTTTETVLTKQVTTDPGGTSASTSVETKTSGTPPPPANEAQLSADLKRTTTTLEDALALSRKYQVEQNAVDPVTGQIPDPYTEAPKEGESPAATVLNG